MVFGHFATEVHMNEINFLIKKKKNATVLSLYSSSYNFWFIGFQDFGRGVISGLRMVYTVALPTHILCVTKASMNTLTIPFWKTPFVLAGQILPGRLLDHFLTWRGHGFELLITPVPPPHSQ